MTLYHFNPNGDAEVCEGRLADCPYLGMHVSPDIVKNIQDNNPQEYTQMLMWLEIKARQAPERNIQETYPDFLKKAKLIHPKAKVVANENGTWDIVIPTQIHVWDTLPQSYEGTPAWTAYHNYENGEDELSRWARKNWCGYDLIVEAADVYNVQYERQAWVWNELNLIREKHNIPPVLEWNDGEQTKEWAKFLLETEAELKKESVLRFPQK